MALFGSKDSCPACGASRVGGDGILWVCTKCGAHGSRFRGAMIYAGIHGNPRTGEAQLSDTVDPTVLSQLAAIAPELRQAASDSSVAAAFNYAASNILYCFESTTFDIEDEDVNAAIAASATNVLGHEVRRDDNRFHLFTAAAAWGWWWRCGEWENEVAPKDPAAWLASLTPTGWTMSRSERLGNAAQNYSLDDDLPATSIGLADHGEAVVYGSFLLFCATLDIDEMAPRLGMDIEHLAQAHRFGIAMRAVAFADELAVAPSVRRDDPEADYQSLLATLQETVSDVRAEKELYSGGRVIVPSWVAWRVCRMATVNHYELLDDEYLRIVERGGEDEESPGEYSAYLERLVEDHGLSTVVERLHADCFG